MRRVQLSSAQVVLVDMKGDQRLPCGEVTQSAPPESPLRPGGPRYLHVTCYKLAYNNLCQPPSSESSHTTTSRTDQLSDEVTLGDSLTIVSMVLPFTVERICTRHSCQLTHSI